MAKRIEATERTPDTRFFGHPRGLATLFMTELWERFSYYGMRALLILFMTASVSAGGLGFEVPKAGAIYGLYTSMVYMFSLPGGWMADRFLGQRRAVFYGGAVIALGNFCLAAPSMSFFYVGLMLIVVGTGLLKPNVSVMVGQLYEAADARRDAGFSIFYMGINLGAFLAPLACGYVGQKINWHLGFALAGVGMTLGLIQYVAGGKHLGEAGLHPVKPANTGSNAETTIAGRCDRHRRDTGDDSGVERGRSSNHNGADPFQRPRSHPSADGARVFPLAVLLRQLDAD
jgi:POT family proton-dependent oligopeptide transporter